MNFCRKKGHSKLLQDQLTEEIHENIPCISVSLKKFIEWKILCISESLLKSIERKILRISFFLYSTYFCIMQFYVFLYQSLILRNSSLLFLCISSGRFSVVLILPENSNVEILCISVYVFPYCSLCISIDVFQYFQFLCMSASTA